MELNKRVKGKDNLKDSVPDNKRASPNNEQLELALFFSWGGEAGVKEGGEELCQHLPACFMAN